jgi:hypothetical protein
MRVKVGPRPTPFSLGFCSRADLSLVDVAAGVDYVKDDGCGGPGINKTTGREITDSESQDLLRAGMSAGTPPGAEVMQFSVEGDPDLITLSADPDRHANTKRVGHDVVPMWGSMLTEIDIASGLWMWVLRSAEGKQSINSIGRDTYPFETELRANAMQCYLCRYAHNDTGKGCFFNDLDMVMIGMGEFLENTTADNGHPAVTQAEAKRVAQVQFTMWTLLKSTLLLSTRIDQLADYHIATVTNKDAISIHQDDWGVQGRRVSSMPAPASPLGVLQAPFGAYLALRKCEANSSLQRWTLGGALPDRMWTTAPDGRRWCVANVNAFSQPGEVLPCDEPMYVPNASLDCTCGSGNAQLGCWYVL